jgi:hypothetical protein
MSTKADWAMEAAEEIAIDAISTDIAGTCVTNTQLAAAIIRHHAAERDEAVQELIRSIDYYRDVDGDEDMGRAWDYIRAALARVHELFPEK